MCHPSWKRALTEAQHQPDPVQPRGVAVARRRVLDEQSTKATAIVEWLEEDYGLGRGHAVALVHVIKHGEKIDAKHLGTGGSHRDESDTLWLHGLRNRP